MEEAKRVESKEEQICTKQILRLLEVASYAQKKRILAIMYQAIMNKI